MRSNSFYSVFFATVCLPVLAMAQAATYNYARGVNFSQYRTYEWVSIEGAGANDQGLDTDIKQKVDAQLAAKGFTRSRDGAQLRIAYQVGFRREREIALYSGGGYGGYGPDWPYGRDYGDIYSRSAMSTATSSTIPPGHLVLDIYDSSHRDLVWRGNVSGVLSPGNKGNNLQKAVARLLKYFPPKAKN